MKEKNKLPKTLDEAVDRYIDIDLPVSMPDLIKYLNACGTVMNEKAIVFIVKLVILSHNKGFNSGLSHAVDTLKK